MAYYRHYGLLDSTGHFVYVLLQAVDPVPYLRGALLQRVVTCCQLRYWAEGWRLSHRNPCQKGGRHHVEHCHCRDVSVISTWMLGPVMAIPGVSGLSGRWVLAVLMLNLGTATAAAPRWWEQGGTSIRGVWPKCALGDGMSSLGQIRGLPAFIAMLDRLHANNVSTLQMVVYDSGDGYRPEDLWCGLAGSNYSKPLSNIGSEEDWLTFIDAAHARNMTVTSFWNAAYFWTGSPYFKRAEADIRAHGLGQLPEDSPARWFRWASHRSRHVKPADDTPNANWCDDWVWDPDANASYYSVWGCQPTTDYAAEEWRQEMARILTRWIVELKLDGFMFDAPDGYIGAGNDGVDHSKYNPELLREAITGVIRNVSNERAAAFAEIYSDPPLMNDFGFDGEFADDKICPQHSGKYCPPNQRSSAIGQGTSNTYSTLL